MILILSQNSLEITTEHVQNWVSALGGDAVRLHSEDLVAGEEFSVRLGSKAESMEIEVDGRRLDSRQVRAVWYRRWFTPQIFDFLGDIEDPTLSREIRDHLIGELRSVTRGLHLLLENAKWLTHPRELSLNKLEVLSRAAKIGLDIPDTLVTNDREQLRAFQVAHPQGIIVKAAEQGTQFLHDGEIFAMYTTEVTEKDLDRAPRRIFPSLVQEQVEKQFEIRTFYLDGKCWSMAIFSQADRQTSVDLRRYNRKHPNRQVPYQLPAEQSEKICLLMESLGLSTGSVDLMRTPEGRHIFLEINPVGQFGMVSQPCNYHLEKHVAEYLIELDRHHESEEGAPRIATRVDR